MAARSVLRRSLTGVVGLATAGAAVHHLTSGMWLHPAAASPALASLPDLPATVDRACSAQIREIGHESQDMLGLGAYTMSLHAGGIQSNSAVC